MAWNSEGLKELRRKFGVSGVGVGDQMGSAGLWSEFKVVSRGEWNVPYVVTPSGDVMRLIPFWGLAGQLFQLPRAVGLGGPLCWHCPHLLGAPRLGAVVAVTLEDRLRYGGSAG